MCRRWKGQPMTMKEAEELVRSLLEKMGFRLVEMTQYQKKGTTRFQLVVYRQEGVSLDDCVAVHRTVFPRLELAFEKEDVYLEVSSPGLSRQFKSQREYAIFEGRTVSVMLQGQTQWLKGVLRSADDQGVTLDADGEERRIPYGSLLKGKLEFDKEIG